MATKTVDVIVYYEGRVVDTLAARPIRVMPNERAGIVYNGVVYPLYEGNIVRAEDEPVAKAECDRFVSARAPIPYASGLAVGGADAVDHLGIEAWYVETSRLGHYLAVKCSRAAAEKLVEAVDDIGLGVRGWGESRRPAADGVFYDWYLRIEFKGSREECLQMLDDLFLAEDDDGVDVGADYEESDDNELRREQLADLAMALSNTPLTAEDVTARLTVFEDDVDGSSGYLAWRYREFCTRPGQVVEGSLAGQLAAMVTVVREEKALFARLSSQYGPFIESRPHLAERALTTERDRVDTDASWRSPDDVLRLCRASVTYLRHATVLSFGTEDGFNLLRTILAELRPPTGVRLDGMPRHVAAAAVNLTRTIDLVNELIGSDDVEEVCQRGREELLALQDGEFDCLADLPDISQLRDQLLLGDLPFEVLPPGELLSSFVDELRRSGTYLGREVDRRRLDVLTDVAKHFPSRASTMHRGAFNSGGRDNGYVILRLGLPGGRGEDAIAISPWKDEHATFVVRHGCGKGRPWPEVLSKTKREAKELGAHRLVFRVDLDYQITVYEAMVSKIVALLMCTADEFDSGELYFDYGESRYRIRIPYDYDDDGLRGRDEARKDNSPSLIQKILNWF